VNGNVFSLDVAGAKDGGMLRARDTHGDVVFTHAYGG
jgi:hypothetical protein